jgi:hypothetical protein
MPLTYWTGSGGELLNGGGRGLQGDRHGLDHSVADATGVPQGQAGDLVFPAHVIQADQRRGG